MRIYLHRLTVTVISTEESPDTIERLIDDLSVAGKHRIDARTDPANRLQGPSVTIPDPPKAPEQRDAPREAWRQYEDQLDLWRDTWPNSQAFDLER